MALIGNALHRARHAHIPRTEHRRRTPVLITMSAAAGLAQFPTAAIVVALPVLHDELNASLAELQWTVTGYTLALSAFLIVGGRLADIFGRRRVLLAGAALFAAGSVVAALAGSGMAVIVGLVIAGVGGAALTPSSLSIVLSYYAPQERGLPLGIWGGSTALAQGVAPAIAGALTGELGWEWIFWFQVAVAGVVAALAVAVAAESRDEQAERRVDVTGLALAVGALTTLTLAVIQAPDWGFGATQTIVLLAASAVLAVAFVLVERRVSVPLVELSLFRHRNFTGATIVLFILNFSLITALFFVPLFLQEQLGDPPTKAGILLLPITVGMVVGSPLGGRLAERFGPLRPLAAGCVMMAGALFLLAGVDLSTGYADVWAPITLLGLGVGLSLTPMNLAAMNAVPTRQSGQAGGVFTTLSGVGIGFGVAVTGAVFNHVQLSETESKAAEGGVQLGKDEATELDGLLAGASDAMEALRQFSAGAQQVVERAVHEAFVLGLGSAFRLGAFVALAGLFVALALIRTETPADERELHEASS